MNVVLWIVAIVLALVFLASGAMKLVRTKEQIVSAPNMGWAAAFPSSTIKFIGAAEVLGALGLVLPGILGIAEVLVPVAATGLAVVMLGAIATHARRGEFQQVAVNVVLLALAAFVAVERFGPHAF